MTCVKTQHPVWTKVGPKWFTGAMRERLTPGKHGAIVTTPQRQVDGKWRRCEPELAERWRARTRRRMADGSYATMSRYADTEAKADRELREALGEAPVNRGARVLVHDAATAWFKRVQAEDTYAKDTLNSYKGSIQKHLSVSDGLGGLTLAECTRPRVKELLEGIAARSGHGAALGVRSVLSLVLAEAHDKGILTENTVDGLHIGKAGAKPNLRGYLDPKRALERLERDQLVEKVAVNEYAQSRRLVMLVRVLAGTGCRLHEALSLEWSHWDGTSLIIPGTKSENADRSITVNAALRSALESARGTGTHICGDGRWGGVRDRSKVSSDLRKLFDSLGYTWVSSHTFRRTAATLLAGMNQPLPDIASLLGQAPATTLGYIKKRPSTDGSML